MISVFILVDALGWEIVKSHSFLTDLFPVRRPLRTVFGFSSAAIPSILTGLPPAGHGHWNLFLFDPGRSPFRWTRPLAVLPRRLINHRAVRRAVAAIGRRVSRSRGYFQIYGVPVELLRFFDVCEKDDIYAPGGLRPARSIFDLLEEDRVPYRSYSYRQYTDEEAVAQIVRDLDEGVARFHFLYLAGLDAFLHRNAKSPEAVGGELERYGKAIRRVAEAAFRKDPAAAVYVFSDHGMTPVRETFDLMRAVRLLGWSEPRQYLALYDATMARFWFFDRAARDSIRGMLARLDHGHIIGPNERTALGINFPHNRFGDLVFLMRPGRLIHPSYMGRTPWAGMHGFDPSEPTSNAALLARGEPPVPVRSISDLFALMLYEAGLAGRTCARSASSSS